MTEWPDGGRHRGQASALPPGLAVRPVDVPGELVGHVGPLGERQHLHRALEEGVAGRRGHGYPVQGGQLRARHPGPRAGGGRPRGTVGTDVAQNLPEGEENRQPRKSKD